MTRHLVQDPHGREMTKSSPTNGKQKHTSVYTIPKGFSVIHGSSRPLLPRPLFLVEESFVITP